MVVTDPVDFPMIKPVHRDRIFCPFDEVVGERIGQLERSRSDNAQTKAAFFRFLLHEVSGADFDAVKTDMPRNQSGLASYALKYLDPVTWFESKLMQALALGLDRLPPLNILDIGTGPGHFPAVQERERRLNEAFEPYKECIVETMRRGQREVFFLVSPDELPIRVAVLPDISRQSIGSVDDIPCLSDRVGPDEAPSVGPGAATGPQ